jgi:hypothetical protein
MSEPSTLARWIMIAGISITTIGALIYITSRLGFPFGRLPGDIHVRTSGVSCLVPIASSLLISLALSLILNIIVRLIK